MIFILGLYSCVYEHYKKELNNREAYNIKDYHSLLASERGPNTKLVILECAPRDEKFDQILITAKQKEFTIEYKDCL